jgi:hypothetical protein
LADDRADRRSGNGDDRGEAEGDHEQPPFCIAAIHRVAAGNQCPVARTIPSGRRTDPTTTDRPIATLVAIRE